METKSIKIVKDSDGQYLYAAMPDGKIIPMQLDLQMSQMLKQPSFVRVTVTLHCDIPIEDFEIFEANNLIRVTSSNT